MRIKSFYLIPLLTFIIACSSKKTDNKKILNCKDVETLTHGDTQKMRDRISVRACVNIDKLKLNISWTDDVIDAVKISPSERRWKDPEKKFRDKDKMYFYDNLGIRIYVEDKFYEGWIMPKTDSLEIQWQNHGSMKTRKSKKSTALQVEQIDRSDTVIQMRASLAFDKVHFSISDSTKIKLVIILVDSDASPLVKMKDRISSSTYFVLEEILTINNANHAQ